MKLAFAAGIAVLIAFVLAVPRVAGIESWKWALALIGLALIVLAGRQKSG